MCLIAFAHNVHPACPLVLIANRDEFHARPTAALAPWDDHPDILGGRDLEARGGWLALDRRRPRLAAVTNVRETPATRPLLSRGALVRDFLLRFFQDAANYDEYRPWFRDDFLKRIYAESKIVNAVGDPQQWASLLAPDEYKRLKERVDIDFASENPDVIGVDDPPVESGDRTGRIGRGRRGAAGVRPS